MSLVSDAFGEYNSLIDFIIHITTYVQNNVLQFNIYVCILCTIESLDDIWKIHN